MTNINFNGFNAQLNGKALKITKDGEERIYTIKEANNGIEYTEGEEYFYIRTIRNGFYYQFKFEGEFGFIGDKFANDNEFIDTFACFEFGEN